MRIGGVERNHRRITLREDISNINKFFTVRIEAELHGLNRRCLLVVFHAECIGLRILSFSIDPVNRLFAFVRQRDVYAVFSAVTAGYRFFGKLVIDINLDRLFLSGDTVNRNGKRTDLLRCIDRQCRCINRNASNALFPLIIVIRITDYCSDS